MKKLNSINSNVSKKSQTPLDSSRNSDSESPKKVIRYTDRSNTAGFNNSGIEIKDTSEIGIQKKGSKKFYDFFR